MFAQTIASNLDFESGQLGEVPVGWFASSSVQGVPFQAVLVNQGCLEGLHCATLNSPGSPPANWFGNLSQSVAADAYLMRHIRYRAAVRVEGAAGVRAQMWLRVDRVGGGFSAFDNMSNRPITSGRWDYYTIEGNALPPGFPDPAEPYEADIGMGLTALVPLSLYADASGTLPYRDSQVSTDYYIWSERRNRGRHRRSVVARSGSR